MPRDTKEDLFKIINKLRAIAVERYEDDGSTELGEVVDTPEEFVDTQGPGASPLTNLSWCKIPGSGGSTEEPSMFRLSNDISSWNPLWYRYIKGYWPKGTKKYKDDRGRHLYVVSDQSTYYGTSATLDVCVCYLLIAPDTWFIWIWYPPTELDLFPQDYIVDYTRSLGNGVLVKYDSSSKEYFYVSRMANCDEALPLYETYEISDSLYPNLFPPNNWKPLFGPPPGGTNLEPNQNPVYDPSIWNYWPLNLIPMGQNIVQAIDDPVSEAISGPPPFKPGYLPSDNRLLD